MRLIDADKVLARAQDQYMEHDITRAQYTAIENIVLMLLEEEEDDEG